MCLKKGLQKLGQIFQVLRVTCGWRPVSVLLALVLRTVCQLVTWLATLEADQLLSAGQLLLCYPSLPFQTGVQLSLGQTLLLQLLYTHGLHNFNAEWFQKNVSSI